MDLELFRDDDENDYEYYCKEFNIPENIKDDAKAVLKFFSNQVLIEQGINHFSQAYYQFCQLKKEQKPLSLRAFFNQWAEKNGFEQSVVLLGNVPNELFYEHFLQKKALSADVGAPFAHGKWTHSLQIYLLTEAVKAKEVTLSTSVADLIHKISLEENGPQKAFSLWMILFDNTDKNTYSSPELLHEKLVSMDTQDNEAMKTLVEKTLRQKDKQVKYLAYVTENNTQVDEKKRGEIKSISKKQGLTSGVLKGGVMWLPCPKPKLAEDSNSASKYIN